MKKVKRGEFRVYAHDDDGVCMCLCTVILIFLSNNKLICMGLLQQCLHLNEFGLEFEAKQSRNGSEYITELHIKREEKLKMSPAKRGLNRYSYP